ncbi:MAG: hypothetical protein IJL02_05745 [Methanobrevibacter sp.]|uniref:hypothetical protein n=1 Tax=Methanobrevibacter sp. TaxID=66852 RepID=UPI0025E102C4|nr:hypothetical protein [Methanobrevibacter sp.]MBQ6099349.1 hypothetical protein [Methanobrevibacter sp.]
MSEFEDMYGDEFFVIDSNNLNLVNQRFYGYAIQENGIIQEEDLIDTNNIGLNGAYIQVNVSNEKIVINQDFMGTYGLYLYKYQNYFAISNSFIKLVEHLKDRHFISFNKNYADAFLFADLCSFSYNETLINEICMLPRNCRVIIDKTNCQIILKEIDYKESSISLDSEEGMEILDNWYNKWVKIFRTLKSKTNNIIVELSGGFDSRIVASLWITAGIDLNKVFVRSYNAKKHTFEQDYAIASQIADEFEFKLNKDIIKSNKILFHELETPLNLSFYLKFGFHKEMHFTYRRLTEPVYIVTGSGGESIRWYYNKTPIEYSQYITNRIKHFDENLSLVSEDVINSGLKAVKNKFKIDEKNLREIPERMYKEIRCRHHFGKAMVESYFFNEFTLTPLIDSELYKLKLKTNECDDRNLLMALIYTRYCPKLLNFNFEGNREIDIDTLKYAKKLNEKYPLKITSKKIISGPDIDNFCESPNNNKDYVKYNEVDEFLTTIFSSKSFELEFEKYYSPKIYQKILDVIKNDNRYPLKHAYAAISILKIIHDTQYKIINNESLKKWLKSFLTGQPYEIEEDTINSKIMGLLLKYTTSRIDLLNIGSKENSVEIIEYDDPNLIKSYPKWFESDEGKGACIQSFKGVLNLKISCIKDGKLRIRLRGSDIRDKNGNRFPVFIDYTKLRINGKNFIENNVLTTHDNCLDFYVDVKDKEILNIYCEWLPFNSSSSYEKT